MLFGIASVLILVLMEDALRGQLIPSLANLN